MRVGRLSSDENGEGEIVLQMTLDVGEDEEAKERMLLSSLLEKDEVKWDEDKVEGRENGIDEGERE